ncbi:hypothetical protein [Anabaena sp. UHCC 0204]|uniref:hypothetical protein n=1 Tax=Anabaena sp. UHCC 0204 TaxID=2590009 RepID=UPI001447D100|nr:hypothetical protein [Anabaena sp. UHCC 0204]MTJ09662.1 hypothetical protein [Anabaena sp. UHCC 0204]
MSLITNWQRIDVFDEKIEWQKNLAIEVYDICYGIASRFYKKGRPEDEIASCSFKDDFDKDYTDYRYDYSDSLIVITASHTVYRNVPNMRSVDVQLPSPWTRIFSVSARENEYERPLYYEINNFRVGSWLNHIESLRLKLEPIKKAEEEAKKQEQRRNFGRL